MTRSPADEYETPARRDARSQEAAGTRALLRRTVERAREGFHRCVSALREFVGARVNANASDPWTGERDRHAGRTPEGDRSDGSKAKADATPNRTPGSGDASNLVVRADDLRDGTPEPTLPRRDRPFTRPPDVDGDGSNPPAPVGTVDGETLTVELPDRPAASITSDVWERVER